jgi:hypothetical protein
MSIGLAVEEKIDPGLEVALVGWLLVFGLFFWGRIFGQINGVEPWLPSGGTFSTVSPLAARAEIVAGGDFQVLIGLEILVLQLSCSRWPSFNRVFLFERRNLLLQRVICFDGLHPAPAHRSSTITKNNKSPTTRKIAQLRRPRKQSFFRIFDFIEHLLSSD